MLSTKQILIDKQEEIVHLYLNEKKQPKEIATIIGLSHHQPIYNLLKKLRSICKA